MSVDELKFRHPFTCIVAGIKGSGKTFWCYGQEKELYMVPIDNVKITYFNGLPTQELIEQNRPDIIVIDDLMNELKNDETVKNLFTKGSHHLNISVIYITQNIFSQDKSMRTISLNSHYIVILKGIRLTQQVSILGNQIFPGKSRNLMRIFKHATQKPYSY